MKLRLPNKLVAAILAAASGLVCSTSASASTAADWNITLSEGKLVYQLTADGAYDLNLGPAAISGSTYSRGEQFVLTVETTKTDGWELSSANRGTIIASTSAGSGDVTGNGQFTARMQAGDPPGAVILVNGWDYPHPSGVLAGEYDHSQPLTTLGFNFEFIGTDADSDKFVFSSSANSDMSFATGQDTNVVRNFTFGTLSNLGAQLDDYSKVSTVITVAKSNVGTATFTGQTLKGLSIGSGVEVAFSGTNTMSEGILNHGTLELGGTLNLTSVATLDSVGTRTENGFGGLTRVLVKNVDGGSTAVQDGFAITSTDGYVYGGVDEETGNVLVSASDTTYTLVTDETFQTRVDNASAKLHNATHINIENGATLLLDTKVNGGNGVLRQNVTVRNGGTLKMTAGDTLGWSTGADAVRVLTVEKGGTVNLAHSANETISATVNLHGLLTGNQGSMLDFLNETASMKVAAGETGTVENVTIRLRQNNTTFAVGEDGLLTVKSSIERNQNNGHVYKEGAGVMDIAGGLTTPGTLTVYNGTVHFSGGNSSLGTLFTSEGTGKTGSSSVIIGSESGAAATLTVGRAELGNVNGGGYTNNLTIHNGGKLIVTGTNNGTDYKSVSLLLGEWNQKTTATVSGSLYAKSAVLFGGDYGFDMNISGGTVAVLGVGQSHSGANPTESLSITNGGKLILGEMGIDTSDDEGHGHASPNLNLTLADGTIGLSAESVTINRPISVTGNAVIDTALHTFNDAGTELTRSETATGTMNITEGITIAQSGVLSVAGAGTVNAALKGAGTLNLGTVNLAGGQNSHSRLALPSGITLDNTWTGTVSVGGSLTWFDLDSLNNGANANSWVELTGASGFFSGTGTTTANIRFTDANDGNDAAFKTTDGINNQTYTFNGKTAGTGTLYLQGYNNGIQTFKFAGDASAWTGTLKSKNSNGTGNIIEIANAFGATVVNESGNMTVKLLDGANFTGSLKSQAGLLKINNTTGSALSVGSIALDGGNIELTGGSLVVGGNTHLSGLFEGNGKLTVKSGAALTVNAHYANWQFELREGTERGVAVEHGGSFTADWNSANLKVSGISAGQTATITTERTGKNGYAYNGTGADQITIADAAVEFSKDTAGSFANKLSNSTFTNKGTTEMTLTHSASTLVGVNADGGSIVVENAPNSAGTLDSIKANGGDVTMKGLGDAVTANLNELFIADNRTVSMYQNGTTAQSAEANVIVSGKLTAGSGANLNANLELAQNSSIKIAAGGLHMGSSLTLSGNNIGLSQEMVNTLNDMCDNLLLNNGVANMTVSRGLTLFTGVDSFNGYKEDVSASASNYFDLSGVKRPWDFIVKFEANTAQDGGTVSLWMETPEPATATLSLLALAALAARRKRK